MGTAVSRSAKSSTAHNQSKVTLTCWKRGENEVEGTHLKEVEKPYSPRIIANPFSFSSRDIDEDNFIWELCQAGNHFRGLPPRGACVYADSMVVSEKPMSSQVFRFSNDFSTDPSFLFVWFMWFNLEITYYTEYFWSHISISNISFDHISS